MNRSLPSLSFGCRRGAGLVVVAIVSGLLLPAHSLAASRDAVKKAIAATVAVEWRSDRNQFPHPTPQRVEPAGEEQAIEFEPATGAKLVSTTGAHHLVESRGKVWGKDVAEKN